MSTTDNSEGLGSLTQAARSKQLSSARTILIAVGILTILANGVFVFMAEQMVDAQFKKEIAALRGQGLEVDDTKVEELRAEAIQSTKLINGIGLGIGIVFITLGCLVKKYPVPMTITGLVLYLGGAAVFGFMDPTTLASGWLIKILIIVGLFKAVQAAIAYEKEAANESVEPLAQSFE